MKKQILIYPFLINNLLRILGEKERRRLKFACRHPRHTSEATLRDILSISKDTVYGKEHHFEEILAATRTVDFLRLYRSFVPANDYEALRPYVERHKNGEENVLFPGKPRLYATTSGTTSAPKWIPMTYKYLKDVYGRMSHLWTWRFVRRKPYALAGKIFPIVGKECEGFAPDGTTYGAVSGFLIRDIPALIKSHYTQPVSVMSIPDYAARNYVLMRLAMQYWNVTFWSTANPSTILELQRTVDENLDLIITDIRNGTISDKWDVPQSIREELKSWMRPRHHRARELRRLREEHGGRILPKHYWPELQILSTWRCGNTSVYSEKFASYFDFTKTTHLELGYIATECRFGFAIDDSIESVPHPHMHFYEFVEESELDAPNPRFLTIDELEVGKRYATYVTTYSGLYRYNMNDLVEVGGIYKKCPTIHIVGKVNGIVSLTGEKLYELQYMDAVKRAEKEMNISTKFFVGFANIDDSSYDFYYEFADQETSQQTADEFTQVVDKHLQLINEEYASKRQSFRLHAPHGHRLIKDAYARFKASCLEDGFRDGQFKFNLLMQDKIRQSKFGQIEVEAQPSERQEASTQRLVKRHTALNERLQNRRVKRMQPDWQND